MLEQVGMQAEKRELRELASNRNIRNHEHCKKSEKCPSWAHEDTTHCQIYEN